MMDCQEFFVVLGAVLAAGQCGSGCKHKSGNGWQSNFLRCFDSPAAPSGFQSGTYILLSGKIGIDRSVRFVYNGSDTQETLVPESGSRTAGTQRV